MAPPTKTTTIANNFQQQQQQQQQANGKQQARPRKRKSNSNISSNNNNNNNSKQVAASNGVSQEEPASKSSAAELQQLAKASINQISKSKQQQVPSIVKEAAVAAKKVSLVGKQLSSEEQDDIDAGIELDGSSNSGSSVKDMGEDQLKSASTSPIMAAGSSGADSKAPAVSSSSSSSLPATKKSATKQQLAANQEVIDADEELLQKKLLAQRKAADASGELGAKKGSPGERKVSAAPAPSKRRFSSQSSTESQSSQSGAAGSELSKSLCKICNQHVYQMERMLAEKAVYHKGCFRCFQCKIQLRVDSYSSHEGQLYCKTHHKQLFQPQVKLGSEDDVDIVAKSTKLPRSDDYLRHRGRLSELSFSFLQPKAATAEGARQRQMIICENEPKELPKDVVRSDTKVDDGIDQLNLNLENILQKFERGNTQTESSSPPPPSSAGVVIEKPSINIRQTLKAFESRLSSAENGDGEHLANSSLITEKPVVRKLTNINGMFLKKNSEDGDDSSSPSSTRPLPVRRSESLMMRLKKYESRIAGEQVDDDDDDEHDDANNDDDDDDDSGADTKDHSKSKGKQQELIPKKINLSSLKSQWEKGDINNGNATDASDKRARPSRATSAAALEIAALRRQHKQSSMGDNKDANESDADGEEQTLDSKQQIMLEKEEELCRIRQQLARKKVGGDSVRNIYENAIREAQEQTNNSINKSRRDSNDLSALNGTSKTIEIQQQLLKQVKTSYVSNDLLLDNNNDNQQQQQQQQPKTPTTPNLEKDHFQLNLSKRANKLKERFELGLINNNSSIDDSDNEANDEEGQQMSKLEQIQKEKMEDLSVFTDGEIKAREARSLFQQIDRRISAAAAGNSAKASTPVANSRSLASVGASMRAKLSSQNNNNNTASAASANNNSHQEKPEHQPIRLTNNVKT